MRARALMLVLLLAASGFGVQAAEIARGPVVAQLETEPSEPMEQLGAPPIEPADRPVEMPALTYSNDPSPFGGSIFDRPKLTGNWWGTRDILFENGLTFDVSSTPAEEK